MPDAAPAPRGDDVVGALQEHLRQYSKAIADAIWEVQQMRAPDAARVDALADGLSGFAARLDGPGGILDALPDFPRDPACVGMGLGGRDKGCVACGRPVCASASCPPARLSLPHPRKVKAQLEVLAQRQDELVPQLERVQEEVEAQHRALRDGLLAAVLPRAQEGGGGAEG